MSPKEQETYNYRASLVNEDRERQKKEYDDDYKKRVSDVDFFLQHNFYPDIPSRDGAIDILESAYEKPLKTVIKEKKND